MPMFMFLSSRRLQRSEPEINMRSSLIPLPVVLVALAVCEARLAAAERLQIVVADGIGASFSAGSTDRIVSPLACPLTEITLWADEDLLLRQTDLAYTGSDPQPAVVDFLNLGNGLHRLIFDPALDPCEWLRIKLDAFVKTPLVFRAMGHLART